ncbi:unnamed protein product [Urochloa decumbens]|uniref:Ubiquitin-like protease family profile domain-containing protein n=1 Tax=Urochloa decumbens TaxID=240449 RepID=A0ABC9GK27_9POAL
MGTEIINCNLDFGATIFMKQQFGIHQGNQPKILQILEILKGNQNANNKYLRLWTLLAAASLLLPTFSTKVSSRLYSAVSDVTSIPNKNWCELVLRVLRQSQQPGTKKHGFKPCLTLLMTPCKLDSKEYQIQDVVSLFGVTNLSREPLSLILNLTLKPQFTAQDNMFLGRALCLDSFINNQVPQSYGPQPPTANMNQASASGVPHNEEEEQEVEEEEEEEQVEEEDGEELVEEEEEEEQVEEEKEEEQVEEEGEEVHEESSNDERGKEVAEEEESDEEIEELRDEEHVQNQGGQDSNEESKEDAGSFNVEDTDVEVQGNKVNTDLNTLVFISYYAYIQYLTMFIIKLFSHMLSTAKIKMNVLVKLNMGFLSRIKVFRNKLFSKMEVFKHKQHKLMLSTKKHLLTSKQHKEHNTHGSFGNFISLGAQTQQTQAVNCIFDNVDTGDVNSVFEVTQSIKAMDLDTTYTIKSTAEDCEISDDLGFHLASSVSKLKVLKRKGPETVAAQDPVPLEVQYSASPCNVARVLSFNCTSSGSDRGKEKEPTPELDSTSAGPEAAHLTGIMSFDPPSFDLGISDISCQEKHTQEAGSSANHPHVPDVVFVASQSQELAGGNKQTPIEICSQSQEDGMHQRVSKTGPTKRSPYINYSQKLSYDITISERKMYDKIIRYGKCKRSKKNSRLILNYGAVHTRLGDFADSLKPRGELSNETADCMLHILTDKLKMKSRKVLSYRIAIFVMDGQFDRSETKSSFSFDKRLDHYQLIFFPVLEAIPNKPSHWFLIVLNLKASRFEVMDSIRGENDKVLLQNSEKIITTIKSLWKKYHAKSSIDISDFKLLYIDAPKQDSL